MPEAHRPTICLNMIVRDEAHVITEGLASVVAHVDRWVIVDTGSTDGTPAVIEAFFAEHGIPGELHHRPWVDFGTNRTEALQLAAGQCDLTWVMDADDYLVGHLDPTALDLDADAHQFRFGTDFAFWRTQLFRSALPWRYVGVLHEYPTCDDPSARIVRVPGDVHLVARSIGGRSTDPDRFARDAELLEAELAAHPDDERTVFYLAQSYRDSGQHAEALRCYERRIGLGGYAEEVWFARLERARCLERLGHPWAEVQAAHLEAWETRPSRPEPLHALASHHRATNAFHQAYLFASAGAALPPSDDALFVQADLATWRLRDELAICAYYLGHHQESHDLCRALLDDGHLPPEHRDRIEANLAFAADRLAEGASAAPEGP